MKDGVELEAKEMAGRFEREKNREMGGVCLLKFIYILDFNP